jgi:hypothetical protein
MNKYYREWLVGWGYGVMLAYDTVMAYSPADAREKPVRWSHYSYHKDFETVEKVKKKHLNMTDAELSKIYGKEE